MKKMLWLSVALTNIAQHELYESFMGFHTASCLLDIAHYSYIESVFLYVFFNITF